MVSERSRTINQLFAFLFLCESPTEILVYLYFFSIDMNALTGKNTRLKIKQIEICYIRGCFLKIRFQKKIFFKMFYIFNLQYPIPKTQNFKL